MTVYSDFAGICVKASVVRVLYLASMRSFLTLSATSVPSTTTVRNLPRAALDGGGREHLTEQDSEDLLAANKALGSNTFKESDVGRDLKSIIIHCVGRYSTVHTTRT